MKGVYGITDEFEKELGKYTGAKYVVCVDNASNALFLCLKYEIEEGQTIEIPSHTYPSVPCEIIHAGGKVKFAHSDEYLRGAYRLKPTNVWDSALRFTAGMYIPGSHMCLSFTGHLKHLKLSKGGAILTDSEKAYDWFRRARYSGRRELPYHQDHLDMIGINCYMMPELAARGLLLIKQFYTIDGGRISNDDLTIPYPDLSTFPIYTTDRVRWVLK
jgi:dTDP-4-amino-4,6-dideoxygalactose transaminase